MGVRVTAPVNATFVHLQKTGGSSIQNWLVNFTTSQKFNKHAEIPYIRNHFPNHGILFTVVRNPYERFVSWYFYYMQKTQDRIKAAKSNSFTKINPKKQAKKYNLERNEKVLNILDKGFKFHLLNNSHLTPQCYTARACDITLRLENINNDFTQIQDLFGIHEPLKHVNKSKHNSYRDYYDDEMIEFVKEKHKVDFDYFGYEF